MAKSGEFVSWGVMGVADIATKKVIPAMQGSDMSEVIAIASRSEERAARSAEELEIPRAYGSYRELLEDPDIEAVYIPLPNHLHPEWTVAAARAGKHVLCEKPLATTSVEARRMIDECEGAGVKLMEAFMYRLHPMWILVRDLVKRGAIGDVLSIQTIFTYHNVDPADIRNITEYGGGALYDIGCYAVNAARMLYEDEPSDVKASIRRDPSFGTDVVTSALLDFGGRHSTFTCSTQLEDDQRVTILGSSGRLVVEIPFNIPPDRATRVLHYSGGTPPTDPGVTVHEVSPTDQYAVQTDAFSSAIRGEVDVPTPPVDAVRNLEVIERIFAAAGD